MCSYSRMISEKASLEIAVKMIKNLVRSQGITIYEAVEITIDDKDFEAKVLESILTE